MTEIERNLLIEKMVCAPRELTDAEIASIIGDEKLRAVYELSVMLKESKATELKSTPAEEWEKFRGRISGPKRRYGLWLRVAACIAAAAVVALPVVKVVVAPNTQAPMQDTELMAKSGKAVESVKAVPTDTATVTTTVAAEPKLVAEAKPIASRAPRKKGEEASEVDERIRIEQARIDNEVAMALAEVYATNYGAMCIAEAAVDVANGEGEGGDRDISYIEINKVIML